MMYEELEWLNLEQAAELANRVVGLDDAAPLHRQLSASRLRRAIQGGMFKATGISYQALPGRYYVSRADLVMFLAERLCEACGRALEELGEERAAAMKDEHGAVWVARRPHPLRPARP